MKSLLKKLSLVICFFMVASLTALASSNKTYYAKAVATATGAGKVYVGTSDATPADDAYSEASEAANSVSSSSSPADVNFYLFVQYDNATTKFAGWYNNEECTGEALSASNPYKATVSSNSTTKDTPVTKNYYAKFVEANAPLLRCDKDHVYLNIDDEPVSNDGVVVENATPTYQSGNVNVVTVDTEGKLHPVAAGSAVITVSAEGVNDVTFVATVVDNVTAGKTQIGNGDFEDWRGVTSSNHAPDNWNSFETNEGTWATAARAQQIAMIEGGRPGSNGLYCVDIYSRSVMGTVAQGNLTLGYINAGATSAVNANNHNRSKITDPKKSETIDKIPSAIKLWVKFVPAAENEAHPNARVAATVHDAHNYITQGAPQFETDENASYAIAQAALNFPACEWTELTIPFELTGNATAAGQKYIIVNISTNADAGQGQAGDHLYIDDVQLVYPETDYATASAVLTDAQYSTFVAPFDVNVPYGMKAYTVEGVEAESSVLTLVEVEGKISANTPVVLNGTAAANLVAYGVAAPATAEAGLLTGVYTETTAPVGSYVLQNHDDVVGFYLVEDVQPTVGANRCYLTLPAPSSTRALYFEGGYTTALNTLNAESEASANVFDLQGRHVNTAAQKGMFIINGKKVIK